jgi:hypothetical protein
MEALERSISNLERVRNDFENASTAVDNALTDVQVDVLDANMQIARHRATAAMEERKRRRLSVGVGAGAGAGAPAVALVDRESQAGIDDAVLDAQAQVQDMLRAMARVHSRARELATRVTKVRAAAAPLLASERLSAVKELENENSCVIISLLLAHADVREPLLRSLSIRRLWLLRRVCRTFRTLATAALNATPRPVVGGWVQTCEEDGRALEVLDLATMRWEPLPPLEQALRSAGICCRYGRRLIVAGGSKRKNPEGPSAALTRVAECSEFDPLSRQWRVLPQLQTPRSACRLVACPNGRVIVLGGAGRARLLLDSVEMLEPGASAWVELAPMRRSRVHFAAGVLPDGRVIAAGGVIPDVKQSRPGEAIHRAEIYDPSSNTWEEIAPLPPSCRAATGGWITGDGRFAVYGLGPGSGSGDSDGDESPDAADDSDAASSAEKHRHACAYDPASNSWEPLWETSFMKERGQECSMATGVTVRSSFIITGGFKRGNTGGSGAQNTKGSSRLTCTELLDEETGRNFVLPFDRTTSRERLFSTLWPSATCEEPAVRMGAGAAAAGAVDGWAPPDVLALDSNRMAASTP